MPFGVNLMRSLVLYRAAQGANGDIVLYTDQNGMTPSLMLVD